MSPEYTRRQFLMTSGGLAGAALLGGGLRPIPKEGVMADTPGKHVEPLGFKEHWVWAGNGKGGFAPKPAEVQLLHSLGADHVMPFGLQCMQNGEVLLLASAEPPGKLIPVTALSADGGATWGEWQPVPDAPNGRPMMLTDLGGGHLTFEIAEGATASTCRFYTADYGRTWGKVAIKWDRPEEAWNVEGNALVDRDAQGHAVRIAAIGYKSYSSAVWPQAFDGYLHWSDDGGRTWVDETKPAAWVVEMEHRGQKVRRGVSEGSLVRARNGDLVAALRVDMPPRYYLDGAQAGTDFDDSLEGLGVSLSSDNGGTWSPINLIYEAGRHHPHLHVLPNGDVLMTYIVRVDVRDGRLASYRRGCEALVSRDHGKTWDPARRYVLDEFEYYDGAKWFSGETGHLASTLLPDGRVLTAYGKYFTRGACLIRWQP